MSCSLIPTDPTAEPTAHAREEGRQLGLDEEVGESGEPTFHMGGTVAVEAVELGVGEKKKEQLAKTRAKREGPDSATSCSLVGGGRKRGPRSGRAGRVARGSRRTHGEARQEDGRVHKANESLKESADVNGKRARRDGGMRVRKGESTERNWTFRVWQVSATYLAIS